MRNKLARLRRKAERPQRPRRLCRGARCAAARSRAEGPAGLRRAPRPRPAPGPLPVPPRWVRVGCRGTAGPGRLRFPACAAGGTQARGAGRGRRGGGRTERGGRKPGSGARRTGPSRLQPRASAVSSGPRRVAAEAARRGAGKSFAWPSPPLASVPGRPLLPPPALCRGTFLPAQAPLQPQLCPQLPGVFALELPQFLLTTLFC